MHLAIALCALIAAHTLGWAPVHAWLFDNGRQDLALQAALHAGLFMGIAGAAISFTSRCRPATPLLFLGCLAVLGLMAEDMMGLTGGGRGWSKDLLDMGQRVGLLMLFAYRLEIVARRTWA